MSDHNPDHNHHQDGDNYNLTFAMSFLPLARSSAMLDYYGDHHR